MEKSVMLIPFHVNIIEYNVARYQQASNLNAQCQQSKLTHTVEVCYARNVSLARQKPYPSNGWKIRIANTRDIVPIKILIQIGQHTCPWMTRIREAVRLCKPLQ